MIYYENRATTIVPRLSCLVPCQASQSVNTRKGCPTWQCYPTCLTCYQLNPPLWRWLCHFHVKDWLNFSNSLITLTGFLCVYFHSNELWIKYFITFLCPATTFNAKNDLKLTTECEVVNTLLSYSCQDCKKIILILRII